MKKFMFAAAAILVAFALIGCPGEDSKPADSNSWSITYNKNGYDGLGVPSNTTIAKGGELTSAHLPSLSNTNAKKFDGWAYDSAGNQPAAAGDTVTSNITLYVINSNNAQADNSVRFIYDDMSVFDVTVTLGDSTWGDVIGDSTLLRKRDIKLDQTGGFRYWADQTNAAWTEDATTITQTLTMKAVWWDNTYVNTAGAEKIALENTTTAVYGFTLPTGKTLQDIKGITYSFQISEYDYKESSSGNLRVWGPYFYNSNPVVNWTDGWNNGTVMYGDFALDRNGVYIAKFNGSGSSDAGDILTYNKFHAYYHNANVGGFGPDSGGNAWADKTAAAPFFPDGLTSIQPKTWIRIDLGFDKFTGAQTYAGANGILARVLETKGKVWPNDTDMNTVYFSVGLYGAAQGGSGGDIGYKQKNHFTQLVKDVKLIFDDDTSVNGAAPSFGNGKVFAGYTPADVVYSYRGPADQPVAFPTNPSNANSVSCICTSTATTDCGKVNCRNKLVFCKDVGCDLAGKTVTTYGVLGCTRGCTDCAVCTAAGAAAWACTCTECIAERAKGTPNACTCAEGTCTVQTGGTCGTCPVCFVVAATADFIVFDNSASPASFTVTGAWAGPGEASPFDPEWKNITFPMQDSVQLDLRSYAAFSIEVVYKDSDGAVIPIVDQMQYGQVAVNGIDHYNLGENVASGGTIKRRIDGALRATWTTGKVVLTFQARGSTVAGAGGPLNGGSIEVHKIIFHATLECADCGLDPCVCKLLTGDLPSPFVRAGDPVVTIVPDKGLKVQLTSGQAGWAGIDFKLAAATATLAEGDVLKFKVKSLGTAGSNPPQLMLQTSQSGSFADQHIGLLNIDETEQTVTIDAAILTKINASTFATSGGIRIRLNNAPTPADFLITSFTVERGATKLFDLAAWLTANK